MIKFLYDKFQELRLNAEYFLIVDARGWTLQLYVPWERRIANGREEPSTNIDGSSTVHSVRSVQATEQAESERISNELNKRLQEVIQVCLSVYLSAKHLFHIYDHFFFLLSQENYDLRIKANEFQIEIQRRQEQLIVLTNENEELRRAHAALKEKSKLEATSPDADADDRLVRLVRELCRVRRDFDDMFADAMERQALPSAGEPATEDSERQRTGPLEGTERILESRTELG